MLITSGKSYRYIGPSSRHKDKIYKCIEIDEHDSAIFNMSSFVEYRKWSFKRDGRSRYGAKKLIWQETKRPRKFKPKISYWK